jgi:hypothetical protein
MGNLAADTHARTSRSEDLLARLWKAIGEDDSVRVSDLDSISIAVRDGEVFLYGHLAGEFHRRRIEEVVQSVPGVAAVQNRLIVDRVLAVQVAQALSDDERTRPFILPVGSSHGWVRLGGTVPSPELQHAAEEVAGSVSSVRGVTALPAVTGGGPSPPRRAVQPLSGAGVYGENGPVGVVSQVVISPRSRLVTHVVIRAHGAPGEGPRPGNKIVPIEAIDVVNPESIFLMPNVSSLSEYPTLDPSEYPPAPPTWQPPYPYEAGAVRWSRR